MKRLGFKKALAMLVTIVMLFAMVPVTSIPAIAASAGAGMKFEIIDDASGDYYKLRFQAMTEDFFHTVAFTFSYDPAVIQPVVATNTSADFLIGTHGVLAPEAAFVMLIYSDYITELGLPGSLYTFEATSWDSVNGRDGFYATAHTASPTAVTTSDGVYIDVFDFYFKLKGASPSLGDIKSDTFKFESGLESGGFVDALGAGSGILLGNGSGEVGSGTEGFRWGNPDQETYPDGDFGEVVSPYVNFVAEQVGGTSGTTDSTGIKLTFTTDVADLDMTDITIGATGDTGEVVHGALTGSGRVWTVALTSITTQGGVTVSVADFGDFKVDADSEKSVTVFKGAGTPPPTLESLSVSLTANVGTVTLMEQTAVTGYAFYYATSTASATAPSYGDLIGTISGADAFSDNIVILGTSGVPMYVQVYKVDTGTSEIVGYGEDSATPTSALTYSASIAPLSKTFTGATVGYGLQTAQEFTITNTGTGTLTGLTAALGGSNFEISTALSSTTVSAGNTVTVSVCPITGLVVGPYTDTLTITDDNSLSVTATLSFTVSAAPTYTATVDPTSKTFTGATTGYGAQTAQVFTIENTGSGALTNLVATLDGSNFEISTALSAASVASGETVTVSVRPVTGLTANTYTDTLTISSDELTPSLTVSLSFTVSAPILAQTVTFTTPGTVSKTYGDANFTNAAASSGTGTVTYESSEPLVATVNASSGEVSILKAGTATITANAAAVAGSYAAGSASYTLNVGKKALSGVMIAAIADQSYNGSPITPTPSVTDTATISTGDYTVSYTNNTAIGTATVTLTATGSGNYSGTASTTFAIVQGAPPTATTPADIMVKADRAGTFNLDTIVLDKIGVGTRSYTLGAFTDGDDILTGTPSLSGSVISFTGASDIDETYADATLGVTITTTNYADCTVTLTFVVTEDEIVTLSGVSVANKVYDATGVSPEGTLAATDEDGSDVTGDVSPTYTYTGTTNAGATVSGSTPPTEAGDYVLTITGTGTGLVVTPLGITFTIERKTVTVTGVNQSIKVGETPVAFTATITGEVSGYELTDPVTTAECPTYVNAVGNYPIIPDASSDTSGNYDIVYVNGTLTVASASTNTGTTGGGGGGGGSTTTNPSGSFSGGSAYTPGGSTGLVYTVNKDFSQFDYVSADNARLTRDQDYTAVSGSTKITLLPAYLDNLKAGSHTVAVNFKDGTRATANFTVAAAKESPAEQTPAPVREEQPGAANTNAGAATPFGDVSAGDWFSSAVKYVYDNGLMNGTSTNLFSPNANLTRGMVVTVLYRLEGSPGVNSGAPFSDVAAGQWYADAIAWAASSGIVTGMTATTFEPETDVTREQLATILYRYAVYTGSESVSGSAADLGFADAGQIASWAVDGAVFCSANGIITGKPGALFDPQGNATRAEFATMLMRYLGA